MDKKVNSGLMNMGLPQKAVVLRSDGRFLALLRGQTAPTYPSHWDLPGGDLEYGEEPIAGIVREIKEESGLDVSDIQPFDVYSRKGADGFFVTIAYYCKTASDAVTISWEHTDFKWVTKEEFSKLPAAPKIIRFVKSCPL